MSCAPTGTSCLARRSPTVLPKTWTAEVEPSRDRLTALSYWAIDSAPTATTATAAPWAAQRNGREIKGDSKSGNSRGGAGPAVHTPRDAKGGPEGPHWTPAAGLAP